MQVNDTFLEKKKGLSLVHLSPLLFVLLMLRLCSFLFAPVRTRTTSSLNPKMIRQVGRSGHWFKTRELKTAGTGLVGAELWRAGSLTFVSLLQMILAAMMKTMNLERKRMKTEEAIMKKKEGKRERKPRWRNQPREGRRENELQVMIQFLPSTHWPAYISAQRLISTLNWTEAASALRSSC